MSSDVNLADLNSDERRRLLEELLEEQSSQQPERFCVSFAQERLWLLDQLTPGNPVYNIWAAVRLKGKLDLQRVHSAIDLLIDRHESLRTIFGHEDGQPYQMIVEPWRIQIPVEDLSGVSTQEQPSRIRTLVDDFIARPFDIARGPLLRAQFIRLNSQEHISLFAMHHAISDGWSLGILIKEFTEVYQALAHHRGPALEPLDIQYADYAQWQRDNQDDATYRDQVQYWKSQFADAPVLSLPYDFPSDNNDSHRGATIVHRISKSDWQQFKSMCAHRSATPFMGLVAVLQLLLSRHSGQDDIVIGTPVAGRSRKELEPLIGCFLNTLCLRNKIDETSSFAEHLSRVRATAFAAYKNQDVPFERVLSELQVVRDTHRSPLFNVMLNLLSYQSPELKLPDLTIERFDIDEPLAKFDITLYAEPTHDELDLRLVYNAALFTRAHMQVLVDQFANLLNTAAADPLKCLRDIALVTSLEKATLADPTQPIARPVVQTVAETFNQIASRYPDRTAIRHLDQNVSYRELQERAHGLAEKIIERSSDSRPVIAIAFDKSVQLIVGMLAVQLAERALVCIDPSLPVDRQQQLLELSHASLLIDRDGLHELENVRQLPQSQIDNKPAYIFFTSGSTGTPKAVVGSRQGLGHFVAWQREQFKISSDDSFAQLTALSFDVLLREVFTPLTSGSTICIPPSADTSISSGAIKWLNEQAITVVHSVPSLLQHWFANDQVSLAPTLRYLFSAGEPLADDLCRQLRARFPNATIVNLYGPTETTLAKFFKVIDVPRRGIQLVGGPLPNTQVLILDGLRRCGIGEIGEIVVRTPFRSHGYLDSESAQLKFIANPWTNDSDDLLYRTGDQGRITPEGELEILGRLDDQVKIRGVRIEPAEVTSALKQYPDIQDCVTLALAINGGNKQLVAYVVPKHDADTSSLPSRLGGFAATKLPPAMNPTSYVILDSIPLLSNGKVDRRNLPLPTVTTYEAANAEPPSTETERVVAKIWMNVLGREFVGRQDSFFAIGGHSLLAAQVISRVDQVFERAVPLRAIFECPTLEKFSSYLDGKPFSTDDRYLPDITRRNRTHDNPLSLAQEALWFLDRMSPQSGAYTTYPMLRVHGDLNLQALQAALDIVVNRHEALRTTFPEVNGAPVQQIAQSASSAIQFTDFSKISDSLRQCKLDEWLANQLTTGIDLQCGPIVRLHIAKMSDRQHVAVVAWHHIIHDGWSLGVLAREILTAYRDTLENRKSTLPALPIQYADWALWQRQILSGDYLQKLSAYWKSKLHQLPHLDLLTDYPRPNVRTTRGDWVSWDIKESLANLIDRFARIHGVTSYMIFLTAFHLTLSRFSGQSDFAIGSPVANRRKRETEDLIGYFINMLVIRPEVGSADTFLQAIQCVKSTVLDAFEHQDMTLDQVVHAVNPARDTSRHPLFQAMFVLHNNAPLPDVGGGLRFEPLPNPPVHSSYFELNLVVQQSADGGYAGRLVYNCDLFRPSTINRLVAAMQMLLESGLESSEQNWRTLPIIDPHQAASIDRFSRPDSRSIQISECRGTLHSSFERAAQSHPQAIALVSNGREFTYQQLNSLANRFAKKLHTQGVQRGDLVALLVPRSPEAIIVILAILKSGAAYVPLDERSPESRNRAILENCGASHLVCRAGNSNFASNCKRIEVPSARDLAALVPEDVSGIEPFEVIGNQDDTAYVIYTSGSTGKPKGVAVTHGAVVAYAKAAAYQYGVNDSDRIMQFSSLSFDAHVEEVFVTLLHGATLILRTDEMLDSVQGFLDACDALGMTTLSMSTGFWHEIALETADTKRALPSSLRTIIIGGEAANVERVRAWYQTHGDSIRLINSYGPTETTVVATATDLSRDNSASEIPIGRPLQNTRAYILDSQLCPVPIGVRGELYLSGLSVAQGYLGNEELTRQKFIIDRHDNGAFGERPEAKMYRTGDIVAWRNDGQIRFFGRNDFQLKIRGFRVELGEIENAIRQHPLVADVVVDSHLAGNEPSIVAYVVSDGPDVLNTVTLRQYLSGSVPDYMLPSHVIAIDRIPLTVSGKIDRKSLPLPKDTSTDPEQYIAPETPTEIQLAAIVAAVLQRDRVSITDNFFHIGGNSLLALRLTSQIRKQFAIDLPLVRLFQSPTIHTLAKLIDGTLPRAQSHSDDTALALAGYQATTAALNTPAGSVTPSLVILRNSQAGNPIFCVHGLGGHIVNFIPLSRELKTTRPIVGVQALGVDGQNAPHENIVQMADYYAEQILARQPTGCVQLIGWSMGGLIAMEIARKLLVQGRAVSDLIMLDTHLSLADRSLEEVTEESVIKQIAPRVGLSIKNLRRLTIEQQWEHVLEASQQYTGSKTSDGNADEIRRLAVMCKSHLIAIGRYQPSPIDLKICLLQAARPWRLTDPRWRGLCRGFESHSVAGSHYSMLAEPDVQQVSRAVERLLQRNETCNGEHS